jgi:hypothetical protein
MIVGLIFLVVFLDKVESVWKQHNTSLFLLIEE